ncbi:MAG: N-acetylmuramoyl-L-alanine amidase [Deltaproteobacteria bacterium]|nr:N-acetylmuramoyl-L-alanine amidase [Deltaproteobacteria bacterium]
MDKRCLRYGILSLLLLSVGLFPATGSAAPQGRYTVLIDAAHGGGEPGVVSEKIREKDLTLGLALLIRQEAQKTGNIQVQLTRSADKEMAVAERIKAIEAQKPDCVLSLHVNAGFGKKAAGYEVYFPGFRQTAAGGAESAAIIKDMAVNRHLNDSVRLAQPIQAALETVFPRKGRGLRDAPSPLLEGVSLPGLVVEVAFLTQPDEKKKLTNAETQKAIARALVKGLREYFQSTP